MHPILCSFFNPRVLSSNRGGSGGPGFLRGRSIRQGVVTWARAKSEMTHHNRVKQGPDMPKCRSPTKVYNYWRIQDFALEHF